MIGFFLAVVIIFVCITNFILYKARKVSVQDKYEVDNYVKSVEVSSEYMNIVTSNGESYDKLSFDSVQDFVSSLGYLADLHGIVLKERKVYSLNEENLLSLYENNEESIIVATYSDESIAYCKLLGFTEEENNKFKELLEDSGNAKYKYKIINNGCILES